MASALFHMLVLFDFPASRSIYCDVEGAWQSAFTGGYSLPSPNTGADRLVPNSDDGDDKTPDTPANASGAGSELICTPTTSH